MKRVLIFFGLALACHFSQALYARSFEELFPNLDAGQKQQALAEGGAIHSVENASELKFSPVSGSGIDLLGPVLQRNPNYLVESLALVPYSGRKLTLVDLYNTLGKIQALKGRLYHSATRDANIPLFEDAVRIKEMNKNSPVSDPADAQVMPVHETIYLRLKDVNFGNSFYRADISPFSEGLLYALSNTKSLSYLFFPVMKEGKFVAQLYLEPLDEGTLVYSIAGTEVSNFVARQVSIPSAISKRMEVFIGWISEGLRSRT